jgi:hypothetical protein
MGLHCTWRRQDRQHTAESGSCLDKAPRVLLRAGLAPAFLSESPGRLVRSSTRAIRNQPTRPRRSSAVPRQDVAGHELVEQLVQHRPTAGTRSDLGPYFVDAGRAQLHDLAPNILFPARYPGVSVPRHGHDGRPDRRQPTAARRRSARVVLHGFRDGVSRSCRNGRFWAFSRRRR